MKIPLFERLKLAVWRLLKREPPEDPYAYVMAYRRPRPGGRSAAAVVEEIEEPDR